MNYANITLAIVNITIFVTWLLMVNFDSSTVPAKVYNYDALTVMLSVMQVFLAICAIMLGVLAVFGFIQIKNSAENIARKTARQVADDEIKSYIKTKYGENSDKINTKEKIFLENNRNREINIPQDSEEINNE